ncbi:MAG: hypothetical protein AUK36_05240 [Zetaproteobacteria bacterium CG2_30_59_37]|nr:MAG: hypothetical protein AUK36_05240 [Zetaproteobacteria bacterium CG2_30_59_37]
MAWAPTASLSERLPYKAMLRVSAVFILLLPLFFTPVSTYGGTLSIVSQSRWVEVGRVLDGDTFVGNMGEHIRLLGINTPEIAHEASPAQPMGDEATQALTKLIAGKSVRLDFDKQRKDDYGRTLAQLYLRDGTWVNGEMVRLGMAHVYTFTPNLRWAAPLTLLEAGARQRQTGIWSTERFSMLDADDVASGNLGQFRVVQGRVGEIARDGFSFRMGHLKVSIPRKYRRYFGHSRVAHKGDRVVIHGVVRASSSGLYIALHSPSDVEKIAP